MDRREFACGEKSFIGTKKYYWHGFFVMRESIVVGGKKVAEQISIRKRKNK